MKSRLRGKIEREGRHGEGGNLVAGVRGLFIPLPRCRVNVTYLGTSYASKEKEASAQVRNLVACMRNAMHWK